MSKIPLWLKYCGLAAAGIASFVIAMQLGGHFTSQDDTVELRRATISVKPQDGVALVSSAQSTTQQDNPDTYARLHPGVVRDPFSPLNLMATVDKPTPVDATNVADAAQTVKKKKKRKARPPTPPVAEPAPILVQAPIPEPVAPNLPFTVLGTIQGRRITDGKMVVFLKDQASIFVVHVGDEINKIYKVQSISEDKIELIYLPLKKMQTLAITH